MNRALSKLGILSRAQATAAIRDGRVTVDGLAVRDPLAAVAPERARIEIDGRLARRSSWRAVIFHKPRGSVTTRADPAGRRTVFDDLGADGDGLVAVGRLDLATSGLLLLTSDTRLAHWITDPANAVARVYVVTVRGRVGPDAVRSLVDGLDLDGERLRAHEVRVRKASSRETHLLVELREGRNREVRRLLSAIGHEVTRLKRVRLGGLELGDLAPGGCRELTPDEVRRAFPGAPVALAGGRSGRADAAARPAR